ncbi:MAG: alpha/beta fold hydrolase [Cytophagaceae bacterium]
MQEDHLAFTDKGSGYPLVFLHGFCEDRTLWNSFISTFSQTHRVIAPDLPGFGASHSSMEILSMEFLAEEVCRLLDHLNISECVMIGHSMGGYVALAFAEKYPEMLHGICLFHSSSYEDSLEKKESRNKTALFIQKHGVENFANSFVSPLFAPGNRKKIAEKIKEVERVVKSTSAQSIIAAAYGMRDRKDRSTLLAEVNFPVLFISGKEDMAVPVEKTQEQSLLPKESIVHILSDTGHMGMLEKEAETIAIIHSFLTYLHK